MSKFSCFVFISLLNDLNSRKSNCCSFCKVWKEGGVQGRLKSNYQAYRLDHSQGLGQTYLADKTVLYVKPAIVFLFNVLRSVCKQWFHLYFLGIGIRIGIDIGIILEMVSVYVYRYKYQYQYRYCLISISISIGIKYWYQYRYL